jgi:hypothetical protein
MTYEITVNNIDYEAEVDYEIKDEHVVDMKIVDVCKDGAMVMEPVELLEVLHELDKVHANIVQACYDNDAHMADPAWPVSEAM